MQNDWIFMLIGTTGTYLVVVNFPALENVDPLIKTA